MSPGSINFDEISRFDDVVQLISMEQMSKLD